MSKATVAQHYTVEDLGSSLRFVGPYRTQWFTTLLLGLSMPFILTILVAVLWAGSALIQAMGFRAILLSPFFCLGVPLVLYIGANELLELLWQLLGKEVLEVHGDSLTLRHQILGLGITRRYAVDGIRGVSVSPPTETGLTALHTPGVSLLSRFGSGTSAFQSFKRGRVALQRGPTVLGHGDIVHFGSSLDEVEAQDIVTLIHRKFPQY